MKRAKILSILKRIGFFLITPQCSAAILSILVSVYVIIAEPIIGLADNGDFSRIMHKEGIYKFNEGAEDEYLDFFQSKYLRKQYYNEVRTGIISSHTLFIRAAKVLDQIFTGDDGLFDIRFLGAIFILLNAIGIYMIVDFAAYKRSKIIGYLIALLAVFTFADTGYTSYFNSFYQEGLSQTSLLIFCASALLFTESRYNPIPLLLLMFLNGIILISAKQQNSLLGICFAIMFFLWAFTQFTENHEFIHGYLAHYRRMLLGLAGFFLVFSLVFYKLIPEKYVHINQYHAMTRGVLMTSDNPEDTLKEFNSSIQFSLLNKSEYYEKYPPIDVESPTLISDFYPNTGFFQIGFYYLRHLDQLYKMLDIGTHQAYFLQPEVIGSYEESAGYPPGTITNVFTLHSRIFKNATPRSFGFLLVWMIAILLANFKNKSKLTVLFTIMIVGLSQIVISVLGAGDADLTKHLFLYNSAFDLVNFIVVCSILQGFASYITQKIHIKTPATKRYEYKQE